jgi:hypothetical protein
VHPSANELIAPVPQPGVHSNEHADLVRRELEAPEIEICKGLERINRKHHSQVIVCEQIVYDDFDELLGHVAHPFLTGCGGATLTPSR